LRFYVLERKTHSDSEKRAISMPMHINHLPMKMNCSSKNVEFKGRRYTNTIIWEVNTQRKRVLW